MNILFKKLLLVTTANMFVFFSFGQPSGGTASLTIQDESKTNQAYNFPDAFPVGYVGAQSSDAHGCQLSYTNGFDNNDTNTFVQVVIDFQPVGKGAYILNPPHDKDKKFTVTINYQKTGTKAGNYGYSDYRKDNSEGINGKLIISNYPESVGVYIEGEFQATLEMVNSDNQTEKGLRTVSGHFRIKRTE